MVMEDTYVEKLIIKKNKENISSSSKWWILAPAVGVMALGFYGIKKKIFG
jgi:hypothetical protein